jgi:ATP-dependent helicase/nuclease subunit B
MNPFLKQLVETVKSEHQDIGKVTMVVPTQRSAVYIKKYLIESAQETSWAPTIITIDDFIKTNCKLKSIDSIELLFLFYELYVEIEKEHADSFFYFSKWAPTLLADFNEMDHYMVNPTTIFNDLRNIKEIDDWSFNEDELTDLQQNFTVFWKKLPSYYAKLNDKLTELEKGYSGKLYKWVATSIYEILDDYESNTVYFAGFNALSTSEELIIETFVNSGKGQLILDGDEFYIDNADHEAGYFLRQQIAKKGRKSIKWIDSYFSQNEKKIEILSAQSNVMMAKTAGEILSNLSKEEIKKTALVLADETLLLPVLNSIPESIEKYNISLGYALSNSPIFSLLNSLFSIQESFEKHNKSSLHYKSFLGVVEHYLMKKVVNIYHIKQEIVTKNITFISSKFIKEKEELNSLGFVFTKWNKNALLSDAFSAFDTLISMIVDSITFSTNSMELEYLFSAQKVIRKVENKLTQKDYIKDLKTLKHLFFQLFKSENVSFIGEPLSGLQIIGMLETRALDFENIILLSVNEDVLPKGNTGSSFFPYELKRLYNLPTYKEKEAIYANHFYRLLQRSSKVSLVYNNSTSGFGASEKSRYIEQLKVELTSFKNITVTEKIITSEINKTSKTIQEIQKDGKVMENLYSLAEYGFSPSALIKFKNCPLDFYYTYVVGLREEEEVEEDIEANTFGNIVHKVLEKLYEPCLNKIVIELDITRMLSLVDEFLTLYFKREYSSHFDTGKNYLMYNGAKKTIIAFLKQELETIKNSELIVKGLERREVIDFEVDIQGNTLKTKLRGTIDRIDELNQTKRIIDYKTGKVSATDLNLKDIQNITSNNEIKDKAFQLLFYDLLLESELKENQEIIAGIISTKAISSGLFQLNLKSSPNSYPEKEDREEFKKLVKSIIQEIFDSSTQFVHNEDAKFCRYCE